MKFSMMRVEDLKLTGNNVREVYGKEELEKLKASVFLYGICVPISVGVSSDGYEVLDGGRRLQVARELGIERVPAVVLDGEQGSPTALAWVCNFEREAVPFIEEARWMGRMVRDGGASVEELSAGVGRSAGYVRARLAVLDWPVGLLSYCDSVSVSYSVAREYARLGESRELELALEWNTAVEPSYRQAVAYVDEILRAREIVVPAAAPTVVAAPVRGCYRCQREIVWSEGAKSVLLCGSCLK